MKGSLIKNISIEGIRAKKELGMFKELVNEDHIDQCLEIVKINFKISPTTILFCNIGPTHNFKPLVFQEILKESKLCLDLILNSTRNKPS